MNKLFAITAFVLFLSSLVFAANENITITTYYPSPDGVYRELTATNRLNVGLDEEGYAGVGDGNYGSKLWFQGAPDMLGGYTNENSDAMWMARYNAVGDQSELRVCLGDNALDPTDSWS